MMQTITFETFFIMDGEKILVGPLSNAGCALRKKATYKKRYYPNLTIAKKINTVELRVNGDGIRR
jgi:hypothetical protein